MVLLLTGGTGFFGKALLRHWLAVPMQAPQVTVLSRTPQDFLTRHPEFANQPWLHLHQGDILNPASLPSLGGFTHLLHAAADSTYGPRLSPLQRYTQIVDGTRHLLDYAVAHHIHRFLLVSSGGAYGPQPQDMHAIPESYNGMPDPLNPEHAYGVAKRCAEHLCALYQQQHSLQTVIARCFAFVGRDLPLDVHFAIGNFIHDALIHPQITINGDGTPMRSYMDQRDLAHWMDVLLCQGHPGHAYNVGSDTALSIAELAHQIRNLLAPGKPVHITAADTGSLRNRYVPCIAKARSELGLDLRYTLQDAVLETARFARAAP
ncbi:MAG: NAD(P)-dependent oxidoreductase [Comamonadaceae bacterium]|nr:NAD(P)-dependent oxidoreductase [Comamonadaceae bacterium]